MLQLKHYGCWDPLPLTVITMPVIMALTKRGLFSSHFENLLGLNQCLKDARSEVSVILQNFSSL